MVLLLISATLAAAVVGLIGYECGRNSLRAAVFDALTQQRESQLRAIRAEVADLKNSLVVYSGGSTAVEAVEAFTAGFDQLFDATVSPDQQRAIVGYYTTKLISPTLESTGNSVNINAVLPTSNAQKYLQALYTAPARSNRDPIRLDDAHDGSAWSAANARYNGFFRDIVTRFDYGDALLLDTRGNVVYCADKDADLGTNILTGPYRESNLRDAYLRALGSNSVGYVAVTDFQPYQPQSDMPIAWLVSPIAAAGQIHGVLALPFPITKINRLMTAGKQWQAAGMGRTGETYLAGPDGLMRSDSRLFLQNPAEYRRDAVAAGTPREVVNKAIRIGGTTLVQPVDSPGLRAAQRGQSGTVIATDYLGQETLQAYAPVAVPGGDLNWSIITKVDTAEAFAAELTFTEKLVLATAAMVFLMCLAAMLLAGLFVRPLRRLEAGTGRISTGDYDVTIPVVSRDEIGDLTGAFNEMSRHLRVKQDLLDEQRRENDRLLLSLMPEPVVQRYRDGEQTIAQEHHDATVLFADIIGLPELSNDLSGTELLAIVNDLLRQFDASAESLGIERVRTLHNSYLASCGLQVPRLDNAARTVEFAREMERIIDQFGRQSGLGLGLGLRAGINTGRVVSGLVGRANVVYDLWGPAVSVAYQTHNRATQPGIYVTSPVVEAMRGAHAFTPACVIVVDGSEQPIWRLSQRR